MRSLNRGFTLIELITVLVILGIVAGIGSSFLITTVDSYRVTENRAKLISRGRVTIEQMTRQLRLALPNSLRVSASGNCLEFFPLVAGVNYIGELPDSNNGAPQITTISTAPITFGLGVPLHAVVGGLSSAEIYSNSVPAARTSIAGTSAPPPTITLSSSHRFIRNSINKRVFLADNPKRFCVSGNTLVQYQSYGLDTGVLSDGDPGGSTTIMSFDVAAVGTVFTLSPGSEQRNAAVYISLAFTANNETVDLNQTVLIRNVP